MTGQARSTEPVYLHWWADPDPVTRELRAACGVGLTLFNPGEPVGKCPACVALVGEDPTE